MEWNPAYLWLLLALALAVGELFGGGLVLLALAVAAGLTALAALAGAGTSLQLLTLGVASGILVPLAIKVIKPRFSPRGVAYGTTGTGVERGRAYRTLRRDFDGASGIKVNGDFYRLRLPDGTTDLPEGTRVIFEAFDGTTAQVRLDD
ncbi:NfeD family protein [Halomonas sp. 328]|uniref:NfeD family protein n=1 Tax=Halomonas sp. 328 TaxID=2776704 RepID=UPI0018A6F467|nr:NfeD family protein [Halomonas sp. 328]MBF8222058.1 NfeD family protein [Halomonas sp. 328]